MLTNKFGTENFKSYLQQVNNVPDARYVSVDNQKFNGRITLKESFEYYSEDADEMQLDIFNCAINRTVGDYL